MSATRFACRSRAPIVNVTVSAVAVNDAGHGLGVGPARRAAAIIGAPRGSGGAGPDATGSVSAADASSGMQIFSQTTQLTRPRSVTREPGATSAGTVIGIGSTTSFE